MSISSIVPEPEKPGDEWKVTSQTVPTETTDDTSAEVSKDVEIKAEVENPTQIGETTSSPASASDVSPTETTPSFLDLLMSKITPVTETRKTLKMMIYGDFGTRKSSFLGTIPNNLIIDVEDGLASLNNQPLAENVRVLKYKSFEGLEQTIKTFHESPEQLADIHTISVDSFSELHKRGLAEVTEREHRKAPSLNNRYVAETEGHTENNEHIRRLLSSMRDLDRNIVITAHARTLEPKDKPAKTFPDFSEKLSNTLAGIVDLVGYMRLDVVDGETVVKLQFQGTSGVAAKSRIGGIPPVMINPTWNDIWEIFTKNN